MTSPRSTPTSKRLQEMSGDSPQHTQAPADSPTSHRRGPSAGVLRNFSSPSDLLQTLRMSPFKEKMDPALRQALERLQLRDLDALEQCFIKTNAFLQPWAEFRDSFMLLHPNGITRGSSPGQITRRDLLYFYTFFHEGKLRYDPRADPDHELYTSDTNMHYIIDKSYWDVVEYEKLLYVWLLQAFQVGKAKNPHGIAYLEKRNICTAWEEVFVPIVKLVRSQYDAKGRYHYGRLAKVIEEACPSRLAFPEGNVTYGMDVHINVQRCAGSNTARVPSTEIHPITGCLRYKTSKWEDDEKELREVYPQYGQVVERPKPKWSFNDWIQEQRAQRAALQHAKTLTLLEGGIVSPYPPTPSAAGSMGNDDFITGHPYENRLREAREMERKKRESPLKEMQTLIKNEADHPRGPSSTLPSRRVIPLRQCSNGVYTAIGSSNPFVEDAGIFHGHRVDGNPRQMKTLVQAVTAPAEIMPTSTEKALPRLPTDPGELHSGSPKPRGRKPSYEGTGYGSPILSKEGKSAEKVKATRIPSPVEIFANDSARKYHPTMERATDRAPTTSTTCEPPPPIPAKNPDRYNFVHPHTRQLASYRTNTLGPRIVSKENIRAALNLTMDDEPLDTEYPSPPVSPSLKTIFSEIGGRGLNTGESPKVQTYNTHMFPRMASRDGLKRQF